MVDVREGGEGRAERGGMTGGQAVCLRILRTVCVRVDRQRLRRRRQTAGDQISDVRLGDDGTWYHLGVRLRVASLAPRYNEYPVLSCQ